MMGIMLYLTYLFIAIFSSVVTITIYNFALSKNHDLSLKNIVRLESLLEVFKGRIKQLEQNLIQKEEEIKAVIEDKYEALRQSEVAKSKLVEFDKRLVDFEQNKKETLESSKAAIFEIAGQLSSKLISDHRRENEEVRKNSLEKFHEVTQNYQLQFDEVLKSVASLNSQVRESKEIVDVVKQALLSPGGAGNLAEITLENILKSSGLVEGKDFKLQYSIEVGEVKQRPDAIIFLPSDNIFIVDSKSSKFFHEAEFGKSDEINAKLLASMKIHLKQLASKEYQKNVIGHLKNTSNRNIKHVSTIMFLPSEAVISKLQALDYEFLERAWQLNIFPAGPAGLVNILSHAKYMISEEMQVKNHQIIVEEVANLLSSFSVIYDYARKVGSSLQSATINFDKFAGSFNRNILGKGKKLANLGVTSKTKKELPPELERFQIMNIKHDLIELEPDDNNLSLINENIEDEVI